MFEEINKLKIRVHDSAKKGIHYIPNIISVHPLDELYKATEWLVAEAVKDYTETHGAANENRRVHGYSQTNLDSIDELDIRIGSRTQGYVNQLCLMEDILVYEYERMAELLNMASGGEIALGPKDFEHLTTRFASIRTFRNKVVAHTAYTYPKIDRKTGNTIDNPETIVRSILNLFPREGGFKLGANYFSGFSPYVSELPVITIFTWESEIMPIFQDWKKLFIEKLLEVHKKCPVTHSQFSIESASPHLVSAFSSESIGIKK